MYKKALVDKKIRDGARLIHELDRAGFQVRSGFWFFDREIEDWRLVVHFPQIDRVGSTAAFGIVQRVMLSMHPKPHFGLDDVMVQSSNSFLIQAIQSVAPTPRGSTQIRKIGPVAVGQVWIEEAHIYRSAA